MITNLLINQSVINVYKSVTIISLEQQQAYHMHGGKGGVMMVTTETHLAVYLTEYLMQN